MFSARRKAILTLLGAVALSAAFSVQAADRSERPGPPSLNDLRGRYDGTYDSTTHDDRSGPFRLQITYDRTRGGARVLKGSVKLGTQNFGGLVGAYNPTTQFFQLTGRIGNIRRPRGAIVIAGRIAADAVNLEMATYTLGLTGQEEERGDVTANR